MAGEVLPLSRDSAPHHTYRLHWRPSTHSSVSSSRRPFSGSDKSHGILTPTPMWTVPPPNIHSSLHKPKVRPGAPLPAGVRSDRRPFPKMANRGRAHPLSGCQHPQLGPPLVPPRKPGCNTVSSTAVPWARWRQVII